jgi:phosphatidylinositol alpha-1,6-mannosyltransferase
VTILLLTEVFPPRKGGSGRWFWELYRRLAGVNVHVVAGHTAGHSGGDASFDRAAPLPITRLPLYFKSWGLWDGRSLLEYARAFLALRPIVAGVKPDVIHCGKCLPEGLLAATFQRWRGIPFLTYVHGEELTLAHTSKQLTRLTHKVLRQSTRVIANSHHTKGILRNDWNVPEDRIVVLHPGVDTTRFVPAESRPDVRARLGWAGRRVILTAGALQKRKGQDMLIRALPAIRARCPDVLYCIVGEGWERAYLDQLVAEHGVANAVQFRPTPDDEELVECYQQCDLFALPNRQVGWDFEGFGIVLLEAQASGKPVIAGASGGTVETFTADVTGRLVNCESPDQLATAVCALLDDPKQRSKMGENARQWVVSRFDWSVLSAEAGRLFATVS